MASVVQQNIPNQSERTAIYQHNKISTKSHLIITTMESRTLTELDKL